MKIEKMQWYLSLQTNLKILQVKESVITRERKQNCLYPYYLAILDVKGLIFQYEMLLTCKRTRFLFLTLFLYTYTKYAKCWFGRFNNVSDFLKIFIVMKGRIQIDKLIH